MNSYYKDFRFIIAMIFLALYAIYVVFFEKYNSINCIYNKCTVYHQYGIFGFKSKDYSLNRQDIEKYDLGTKRHRTSSRRHTSYHTDYYPVLIMKNGQHQELPFYTCREKYKAEELALDIMMGTGRLKNSTHPFGW